MLVKIYVSYKKGVLDPQGKAVLESLKSLGYTEFENVRVGKYFEINISDNIKDKSLIEEKIKEINKQEENAAAEYMQTQYIKKRGEKNVI